MISFFLLYFNSRDVNVMALNITCDTDVNEIISVDDINPFLNSMETDLSNYKESITKNLTIEVESGGLSISGLNINDEPLLEEATNEVIGNITCDADFFAFKENVIIICNNQRKKELVELSSKISEKIADLRNEYLQNIMQYNSLGIDATPQQIQNYFNIKTDLETKISFYEQKKATVEGMMI